MQKRLNKNFLTTSGILFSLCLALVSCGFNGNGAKISECKNLVKDRLRSPGSAKFLEVELNDLDGKSYEIVGRFDAQNGFGALLRGSFKCMGFEGEKLRLIYVE